jgi:hypothetical protein
MLEPLFGLVKRILKKGGYPLDKQEKATVTVLEQAEVLSGHWGERMTWWLGIASTPLTNTGWQLPDRHRPGGLFRAFIGVP